MLLKQFYFIFVLLSWNCVIDLLPETSPPLALLLFRNEREALREYIQKSVLRQLRETVSSWRRKTSPYERASTNYIAMKNRYPVPLVSSVFEPLQGATVFTKLNLRNATTWYTSRRATSGIQPPNTPWGHYEYLVMHCGLSNALAVFQGLVNSVLRDMLNLEEVVHLSPHPPDA